MRHVSVEELAALADEFDVSLPNTERSTTRAAVNRMLDGMDDVEEFTLDRGADVGCRSWTEPTDDPYNAVSVSCEVAPTGSGPLDGQTVAVKDIVMVAGVPMRCASATMRGFVPARDAPVVERLLAAGATIREKANLDEFAGSGRGTTGFDGPVRNPHDAERTAGGSSGGSAVAVSTGRVDVAIGTDTGGSIRMPAAFCGVVGVKPTYGLVPLTGVVENTYTMDHVGPLARSVEDAAAVLDVVAGVDHHDPASVAAAGHDAYRVGGYLDAASTPLDPDELTVAVVTEGMADVAPGVRDRTTTALERLETAGVTVREVSVESFTATRAVKNVLSCTELAAHWRDGGVPYRRASVVDEGYVAALRARTRTVSDGPGAFYRSKLLAGARIIDEHGGRPYVRAQAIREQIRSDFVAALDDVDADVLVMPTMVDVAPLLEEADEPPMDYARNTRPADVTQLPAVTLPNGTVDELPVGLQLMGDRFEDASMLRAAATVERIL